MKIWTLSDEDVREGLFVHVYDNPGAARRHLKDLARSYMKAEGLDPNNEDDCDRVQHWDESSFWLDDAGYVRIDEGEVKSDY